LFRYDINEIKKKVIVINNKNIFSAVRSVMKSIAKSGNKDLIDILKKSVIFSSNPSQLDWRTRSSIANK